MSLHSIYVTWTLFCKLNVKSCIIQILETAFKKETVGLVTREQYVEKVIRHFLHTPVCMGTIF
jgi:hypothetical protein